MGSIFLIGKICLRIKWQGLYLCMDNGKTHVTKNLDHFKKYRHHSKFNCEGS